MNEDGYEIQLIKLWTKIHRFLGECVMDRVEVVVLEVTRFPHPAAARRGFRKE
jgi:hypothetical protein